MQPELDMAAARPMGGVGTWGYAMMADAIVACRLQQ